jgi:hypothetical protein
VIAATHDSRPQVQVHTISINDIGMDNIAAAFDFPPEYPGSPQEEQPPSYEETFQIGPNIR